MCHQFERFQVRWSFRILVTRLEFRCSGDFRNSGGVGASAAINNELVVVICGNLRDRWIHVF